MRVDIDGGLEVSLRDDIELEGESYTMTEDFSMSSDLSRAPTSSHVESRIILEGEDEVSMRSYKRHWQGK